MHVGACRLAGNPLAFAVGKCRFTVERGSQFEGDERTPRGDAAEETTVERLRFGLADAFGNGNPRRLQAGDTLPGNERVRVAAGDDNAGDASGNQRVGTGRGAALMRAGFEALRGADGFALLELDEAERLRALGWRGPILLLEGVFEPRDLETCSRLNLWHAVHCDEQIDWLAMHKTHQPHRVFLKLNSGMNRLGFAPGRYRAAYARLAALP